MHVAENPPRHLPLPDDALGEVLSFLPFPQLQTMATINHQLSGVIVRCTEEVIGRAGTNTASYEIFIQRRATAELASRRRRYDIAVIQLAIAEQDIDAEHARIDEVRRQVNNAPECERERTLAACRSRMEEIDRELTLAHSAKHEQLAIMRQEYRAMRAISRLLDAELERVRRARENEKA